MKIKDNGKQEMFNIWPIVFKFLFSSEVKKGLTVKHSFKSSLIYDVLIASFSWAHYCQCNLT